MLGGGIGATLRYLLGSWLQPQSEFPWLTLIINIAGSFAIGWLWESSATSPWFQSWGRPFLVIGILGGFTTFSAFSLETLRLVESDQLGIAVMYVTASMVMCLLGVWAGFKLA